MKRIILVISLLVIAISLVWIGYLFFNNKYFSQTDKPITMQFYYIRYACGDCYPQWNADSLLGYQSKGVGFLDKDMQVYIKGEKLEEQLGKGNDDCIICFKFIITGKIGKTLSGRYRFDADTYKMIKDTVCCNN